MPDQLSEFPTDFRRVLAVVAHPDDVEFGAAPAVAHWVSEGVEVTYLLVTRGEAGIAGLGPGRSGPAREAEQRRAAEELGVGKVIFLDGYSDGVIEEGPGLRRDIARGIREARPDLVVTFNHHDRFSSGAWNTPDHRAVGRATLDAVADAANEWIFPVEGDERPHRATRVAVAGSPLATHAVPVDDETLEAAIRSLAAHQEYLRGLSDDPPGERARFIMTSLVGSVEERFDGRRGVAFELV